MSLSRLCLVAQRRVRGVRMRALAAAGDTWGISGTTFILVYVLIAVIVLVATMRIRKRIADRGGDRDVSGLDSRPYDVAFLNGGADLAVYSALSSMRVEGTIVTAGRGNVLAAGGCRLPRRSWSGRSTSPRACRRNGRGCVTTARSP